MLKRIPLLLALALAATLAAAPPADAGVKRFKLRAGPYRSVNFNVLFPKEIVPAPRIDGYVTDMDVRLVDRKGRPITIRDVMLHHVVFKNASRFVGRRKECRAPNGEAFYGTGEERQTLDLPEGYGYPVKRTDRWRMNVMLMSHGLRPRNVYVEYSGRIVTGRALKRVVPYWVGAHGCSSNPSYPVWGDGGPGSTDRRSHTWRVPVTGRLVAAGGHLHGGAKDLFVTQQRCADRRLFDNAPVYGDEDHLYYRARPILHEPGPVNTRWFTSRTGIALNKGEKLDVVGLYDDSVPHPRVMAITHLYVHPTSRRQRGCRPLPADARHTRRVRGARTEPPVFPVPLNELDEDLRPVEIDRPAGPFRELPSGATVDLEGYAFEKPNIVLPKGARLRWRFMDREPHNVSFAQGPRLIGSKTLANGRTHTTRFVKEGTYKLFCYLHPMTMHQVVQVRGGDESTGTAATASSRDAGAAATAAEIDASAW